MKTERELAREYRQHGAETLRAINKVLNSGRYVNGREVEKFESNFASFIGSKYCVGVGSGFGALYLCMLAIGVKGQGVSIVNELHKSTTNAVVLAGGVPVHSYCRAARIVIPVQAKGFEYPELGEWIEEGKDVIEDACQSLGMVVGGKRPGTFGLAGCFSFHPLKPLHCYGDGGAVVTDSKVFAKKIKELRNHGRVGRSEVYGVGINSRLDEIQAGVLNVELRRVIRGKAL